METTKLKRFAQFARRSLMKQVSAKLKLVLAEDSAARRESAEAIKKLEEALKRYGKEQVVERVAYIWFNRFCALRFMDVNRYNWINIVSPADPGQFQPEILAEAKMGHIDDVRVPQKTRKMILALLDGSEPSRDPQSEAYRLLVVAACNFWNAAMPFLFQRIDDYTELLIPDDLLSGNSILAYTREAMTPDICEDVEVIGWLYQFYISDKKDAVFEDLKKNKKIAPENIPAATQLFTPHWIVRYLVENSLGRLWMLNRPGSKLVEQMDYYIKPEQAEKDFLRINKPEEIKICDPACGSGHMLTYAFDLLSAIYEEEGYEPAEIPEKILTNNLHGIEIDERAGELAAFALTMKARAKHRRFFRQKAASGELVEPNICVMENVRFDEEELKNYMDFVDRDLFTAPLKSTLRQFEEAENIGSLIRPDVTDVDDMLRILESKDASGQLFLSMTHQKVLQALRQADYLSPKYHVVLANPPYMGSKGMNEQLTSWAKDNFPDSKSDLFSMFIERNLGLVQRRGAVAMITMQSWMFLSSFTKLRGLLMDNGTLVSMAHLGAKGFDSIGGEVVQTTAFVLKRVQSLDFKANYLRLVRGLNETEKQLDFKKNKNDGSLKYTASVSDFRKIPGAPIAYWLSSKVFETFFNCESLGTLCQSGGRIKTHDNDTYMRVHWEVDRNKINTQNSSWNLYENGGESFKWYGNVLNVVSWLPSSREFYQSNGGLTNVCFWKREGITWNNIGKSGFRYKPVDTEYSSVSPTAFPHNPNQLYLIIGFLNTKFSFELISVINPSLSNTIGDIFKLPLSEEGIDSGRVSLNVRHCVKLAKDSWNSYENSWNFNSQPLLNSDYCQANLRGAYQKLRTHWQEITLEMQRLEEENNRIFIDAYGLKDELTPEVPLKEITLTCNPYYRYGGNKSEDELEALLLADTMRELVSYAVGCMFGRYSLDLPGLVLANQGETIEDYSLRHNEKLNWGVSISEHADRKDLLDATVERCRFLPDWNNVIPMMEGEWFADNINIRFREFLRAAFGAEHFKENMAFIEKALGKDIRKYFLKDFYNDHVRRYKKRPIYWLFSSPKGSFNALIYMHRYRPDTASVVLNDYLREFRTKLASEKDRLEAMSISASGSQGEKTKALNDIENINKIIAELEEYEREVLYPLATEQVEIDLDDGVKVNYPKFGVALKKIPGLEAKET